MRIAAVLFWLVMVTPVSGFAQVAEPLHVGDMARIRASFKGRPLVLHIWSLTCAPCLIEMPKWAQRIQENPGVAFVFINTDGVRHSPAANRRLAAAGVKPSRSLVYADDFVERLQYEIAPDWLGELPRTEWMSGKDPSLVLLGPVSDVQFRRWMVSAGH
jgi:thiol-disulfide isomerase/thioredoxin